MLGMAITWVPYHDASSLYVGLVNGECDLLLGGTELDPTRAACPSTCAAQLSVLPASDYSGADAAAYGARLSEVCCLKYSIPYMLDGGFALLSIATTAPDAPLRALFSVQVLNAASLVLIAIVAYGLALYLAEFQRSAAKVKKPYHGMYFALTGNSSYSPVSAIGRLMACLWAVFSTLALSNFAGTISSVMTVEALQLRAINTLSQVPPASLCVEKSYPLVSLFAAESLGLPLLPSGDVGGGVIIAQAIECVAAVANGSALAFLSDKSVLSWMSFAFQSSAALYISPVLQLNPMVWAFRLDSRLLGQIDVALIQTMTNSSWRSRKDSLMKKWFPDAPTRHPAVLIPGLDTATFTAAIVLTGVYLLIEAFERTYRSSPRLQRALSRRLSAQEQPTEVERGGGASSADAAARAA